MGEVIRSDGRGKCGRAINMEAELYAATDGLVYPITDWFDAERKPCRKEDAVLAVAGRGFRWFGLELASFGLGLAYKPADRP